MAKLVTILARELGEWPEGFKDVGQTSIGVLHLPGIGVHVRHTKDKYTQADDWRSAIITREMWQAERERLEDEADKKTVIERKGEPTVPVWLGDGLPPVGQVIEWDDYGNMVTVEVVGHYHGSVVAVDPSVPKNVYIGKRSKYRPIKSDRDRWIEAACEAMRSARFKMENTDVAPMDLAALYAGSVYDAGLAKMPEVE